jgi:signal transduction histidine kinase
MNNSKQTQFTLNTGTDIAFALVVCISFFTTFSSAAVSNPLIITLIVFLGVAYITNGIYGFAYASKISRLDIKILYLILQFIFGGLIVYFGKGVGFNPLILLPLVAHTAMLLDQDWMLVANIGIIGTYVFSVFAYSHSLSEVWKGAPFFFAGQVFILIFTQMAVTELNARVKLQNLANELSEANKHLSEYAGRVEELTITKERNRLAREIHDGLGHYLTTINMQIQAATAILKNDQKKALHLLETAQHLTSDALVDVRNSVFALRQELYDITPLHERIEIIANSVSTKSQKASLTLIGEPKKLTPQADLTLYRAAQESINNAIKHSKSKNINTVLDYSDPTQIILITDDDGIGADENAHGYGLLGIKERVRLLEGDVSILTQENTGFKITIKIPSENVYKNFDS